MKNILLIIGIFFLFGFKSNEKKNGCLKLDLILLADLSPSVQGYQPFIADALLEFVEKFEISPENVQIGVVGFNSGAILINPLSSNKTELLRNVISIKSAEVEGSTDLKAGLFYSLQEFSSHGRNLASKIIIIVSDGRVDDPDNTLLIADQLKMTNITICGVLVKDNSSDSEFMKSICGDCYAESNYENLAKGLIALDVCM